MGHGLAHACACHPVAHAAPQLQDARRTEDPRLSFSTPEFKDAQRVFTDNFKVGHDEAQKRGSNHFFGVQRWMGYSSTCVGAKTSVSLPLQGGPYLNLWKGGGFAWPVGAQRLLQRCALNL